MKQFIDSLENRTLFSATPAVAAPATITADEQTLIADAKITLADVRSAVATYHADSALLATDVKALPPNKTNNALIVKLAKDHNHASATAHADVSKLVSLDESAVRLAIADGLAAYANPTAANQTKLAKAITRAQGIAAKPLAKLEADVSSSGAALNADLNALAAHNPSATALTTDIATTQANEATARGTILTQVNTVQTDLSTLVNDLQS